MAKITFLDGAIGSILMENQHCEHGVWQCNMQNAEQVTELHRAYIKAGAHIINSNTFSANRYTVKDCDTTVSEVVASGVRLAKQAAQGTSALVALDIGPLPELLEPYGDLTEEDCTAFYDEIITAGAAEKPDIIFLETFLDIEMLVIAATCAQKTGLPLMCSMSFSQGGRTIMGNTPQQLVEALADFNVTAVGLNCSMEPKEALPVAEEFRRCTELPVIFKPNAGTPQFSADGISYEDAQTFVTDMMPIAKLGDVYIGGCCGTSPDYIKLLTEMCVEK